MGYAGSDVAGGRRCLSPSGQKNDTDFDTSRECRREDPVLLFQKCRTIFVAAATRLIQIIRSNFDPQDVPLG